MPFPPLQSRDPYEQGLTYYGDNPSRTKDGSAALESVPATSGLGSRQSSIRNQRSAVFRRKLIHWLIPEGPMVQMYINPQNIQIQDRKTITPQRTKGGFVVQYWGEELIKISIRGTTGTSGIEGINVLRDVYRNEQLAFDPYALYLAAKNKQESVVGDVFGIESALSSVDSAFTGVSDIFTGESGTGNIFEGGGIGSIFGLAEEASVGFAKKPPTLASLACTVEMYWSGEVYRGFFEDFSVTEEAGNIGMFEYSMSFTATQRRGLRKNFFAWHRSATSGPSNSDGEFGVPHSYSSLARDIPSNPL